MTTWIMPEAAVSRLSSYHLGQRNLLRAIERCGDVLIPVRWSAETPDEKAIPHADGPFILYGGHGFLEHAKRRYPELAPGVFLDELGNGHDAVTSALGNLTLNFDAVHLTRDELLEKILSGETLFVKPALSNKAFNGQVVSPVNAQVIMGFPDVDMIASEPCAIIAEYRFVVAGGQVVTGSQYRRDSQLDVRIDVRAECLELAQRAADLYSPAELFTLDVAEAREGPRVIEYNSFSCSGLYACDGRKIVDAVRNTVKPFIVLSSDLSP